MFTASVAFEKIVKSRIFHRLRLCAVQNFRLLPVKSIPFLFILRQSNLFTVVYHKYILTV